jgi:hypothetical protein
MSDFFKLKSHPQKTNGFKYSFILKSSKTAPTNSVKNR